MAATTTLKLPEKLKTRIARLAKETGRSAHSLMIEALEREVAREERMREFVREALVSDTAVEEGAAVYRAEDVHPQAGTVGQEPKGCPAQTVAQIVYSENTLVNLERIFDFLGEHDPQAALGAARSIREAVDTRYIALYRFLPVQDQVRILAIRHQRELDYPIE